MYPIFVGLKNDKSQGKNNHKQNPQQGTAIAIALMDKNLAVDVNHKQIVIAWWQLIERPPACGSAIANEHGFNKYLQGKDDAQHQLIEDDGG